MGDAVRAVQPYEVYSFKGGIDGWPEPSETVGKVGRALNIWDSLNRHVGGVPDPIGAAALSDEV